MRVLDKSVLRCGCSKYGLQIDYDRQHVSQILFFLYTVYSTPIPSLIRAFLFDSCCYSAFASVDGVFIIWKNKFSDQTSLMPSDKIGYFRIIFLILQPKHMLWILKRTVSKYQKHLLRLMV